MTVTGRLLARSVPVCRRSSRLPPSVDISFGVCQCVRNCGGCYMNKRSRPGQIDSLFLCSLLVLTLAPGLKADVTGSILGTATDSSSAVLQGVVVVATNLETNLSRAT